MLMRPKFNGDWYGLPCQMNREIDVPPHLVEKARKLGLFVVPRKRKTDEDPA